MLTQVIYRERKNISFDIGTKTHLLEFSTFSRLPSARFSLLKLSSLLDTELEYNLLQNDSQGSKSDENSQQATA